MIELFFLKTMNCKSAISVKQSESPKGVAQAYHTAHSPVQTTFTEETKEKNFLDDGCSSACPSLYIQTQSLSSSSLQRASPFQPQKLIPNPEQNSPMSHTSHLHYPKSMFSRSSTFCTRLYSSSSTSSDTNRQQGNLPFLPHPATCDQHISSVHSSKSPLLLSRDLSNEFSEEHSEYLMKDFLNSPGDDFDGSFHGVNYTSDNLNFTEQLDLQFLSEELDIAMIDNGENPRLDEIYEKPQVSPAPTVGVTCNQNHLHHLVVPADGKIPLSRPSPRAAAAHKPRMRWTPELHEHFVEVVNELDGAERATPKGILKRMKVEGLTIYHVKSHLQKYRLAKYMPEAKEDNKASCSEEKERRAASNKESDPHIKRGMQVTEALLMQMEVQKQLHEQLEVQRTLQLRIEEHARYLQKILEEQQKAGNALISSYSPASSADRQTDGCSSPQQTEPKTESSSSLPLKHKAADCIETEQLAGQSQKRLRHETKPEDESVVENPLQ